MDDKLTYTHNGIAYDAEVAMISEVALTTRSFRVRVETLSGSESWLVLALNLGYAIDDFDRIGTDLRNKFGIFNLAELQGNSVLVLKQDNRSVGLKGLSKGINLGPVLF